MDARESIAAAEQLAEQNGWTITLTDVPQQFVPASFKKTGKWTARRKFPNGASISLKLLPF